MRKIEYLSPTSIATWLEDRDGWYLKYAADVRPPRDPQTKPMAVGSAFDAYVKSYLHDLFLAPDPAFEKSTLFEAQVEPHVRDWAAEHGQYVFDQYKECGALDALIKLLALSNTAPRFEFEVKGEITHRDRAVTFLGRPDVVFSASGGKVILDWKINGYCARYPTTPYPGYVTLRGGRNGDTRHKKCQPESVHGITINSACGLESVNASWGRQTAIYAWLLGAKVGSGFICGIDQVACDATKDPVGIRVAEHRYRISPIFQETLFNTACDIMDAIAGDHIFTDLSADEDKAHRATLDKMVTSDDPDEKTFFDLLRL